MSFLVNFLLGLGNPRDIATKSQHLWAVPRQIRFWSILKKVGIGSDPPLIGPNSQLLPNFFLKASIIIRGERGASAPSEREGGRSREGREKHGREGEAWKGGRRREAGREGRQWHSGAP